MAEGLVYIAGVSGTTAASLTIDGCFSDTYFYYCIRFFGNGTGNSGIDAVFRSSGVDKTSNYTVQYLIGNGSSTSVQRNTGIGNMGALTGDGTTATTMHESIIYRPYQTQKTSAFADAHLDGESSVRSYAAAFLQTDSESFDGIKITAASGTITGSLHVWGYRTS